MHRFIQRALCDIRAKSVVEWIEWVGLAGLFLFTFGIFNKSWIAVRGIALMAISFLILSRSSAKEWTRDRLFCLPLVFLLFLALRSFGRTLEFENGGALSMDGTVTHLAAGFLLTFLVAYWVNRASGRWDWLMLMWMAGFLAQILRKMEWAGGLDMVYQFWIGARRATFGSSAVLFGLWSSIVFLGCLLLDREFLHGPANRIGTWARRGFWLIVTLVSFAGLLFSQSRSSWLAAGAVILPSVAWRQFKHRGRRSSRLYVAALIVILASLFLVSFPEVLVDRISSSIEIIRNLFSEDGLSALGPESLNTIPVYERVKIYQLFWESWKKRPWIGYGPGSSEALLEASEVDFKAGYRDFHSLPFEILIQTGIIGITLFAVTLAVVFKQARTAASSDDRRQPYLLLALGGCIMILIYGFFSYPFSNIRGVYLFAFLCGVCYESKFSKTTAPHGTR